MIECCNLTHVNFEHFRAAPSGAYPPSKYVAEKSVQLTAYTQEHFLTKVCQSKIFGWYTYSTNDLLLYFLNCSFMCPPTSACGDIARVICGRYQGLCIARRGFSSIVDQRGAGIGFKRLTGRRVWGQMFGAIIILGEGTTVAHPIVHPVI